MPRRIGLPIIIIDLFPLEGKLIVPKDPHLSNVNRGKYTDQFPPIRVSFTIMDSPQTINNHISLIGI